MTPERASPPDFSSFSDIPGQSHFAFDADLNLLDKKKAPDRRDEIELLGRIRQIIVRNFQSETGATVTPLPDPGPLTRIMKLDREGGASTDYLITLLSGKGGGSVAYRATVQDITDGLKKVESTAPRIERGAINVQEFRKFLHELSNPLSIISGFTEFMLSSMPESAPHREYVQEVFSNALRLREIIEKASPARRSAPRPESGTGGEQGAR